jgi:nucleotide-binding universal stress UspA family protein
VIALVWITEVTWEGCADAAGLLLPADAQVRLLAVADADVVAAASGAVAGLLGRHRRPHHPDEELSRLGSDAARALLDAAARRLARLCERELRAGHVEEEVLHAAVGADILLLARDGDPRRRGPRSLGHATRFVVDHAPCAVLLAWPGDAPRAGPPGP